MATSDDALCNLSKKKLSVIPKEVLRKGRDIRTLNLSGNPGIQLHSSLRQFSQLRKLVLSNCALNVLPDEIGDLTELEELVLGGFGYMSEENDFSRGLRAPIGRLSRLKRLDLSYCRLTTLPYSIGELHQLEELVLKFNTFISGLPPVIGNLVRLKKIDLSFCGVSTLAENIVNLQQLEEIDISVNDFCEGLTPVIGRLVHLKKLNLGQSRLRTLPDTIGNLEQLEDLILGESSSTLTCGRNCFPSGLTAAIGQLGRLKRLDLSYCSLAALPDSMEELKQLCELNLKGNMLQNYPRCTLRLPNLRILNLSINARQRNGIKQLPIELAFTCLDELKLGGHPITEPPPEIWKQGINAIRSFMQALGAGRALMRADTLNVIGDTGAGKTSVAQSLVARSPRHTDEADRTQVLHQLQLTIDESLGHSVIINDFGGHEIYHSVIPIFLPANGLVILVFKLNDENAQGNFKKWLLTIIAKCKEVRVIIVGTHADLVASQSSDLEEQMLEWSSSVLQSSVTELVGHICHLDNRSDDEQVQNKLHCIGQLRKNLVNAYVKVVAVSCLKTEEGQSHAGLSKLFILVDQSLRSAKSLPFHWCRVMNAILNHDGFYITMNQVKDICRTHLTDAEDSEARATILRYLSTTSQIIWLENHELLGDIVFHSPVKILNICKSILHHNSSALEELSVNHLNAVEEYENGILQEAMLRLMLCAQLNSEAQFVQRRTLFDDICNFMISFNIINSAAPDGGGKKFIIPCKLKPSRPTEKLNELEINGSTCLNRVIVQLSFIGSIMPMSFFETSLSSMLTVIDDNAVLADIWRDGLIVHRGGVCFIVERCGTIINLSAFSAGHDVSPWTVLHPVLKRLSDNVHCSWHGAPPRCAIVCPICVPRIQPKESKPHLGLIKTDLMKLTTISSSSKVKLTCENCHRAIPISLCFPSDNTDSCDSSQREIEKFFIQHDEGMLRPARALEQPSYYINWTLVSEDHATKVLKYSHLKLIQHLDWKNVAHFLFQHEMINDLDFESIQIITEPVDGRNRVLNVVTSRSVEGLRCFLEALLNTRQTMLHENVTKHLYAIVPDCRGAASTTRIITDV